MHHWQAHLAAHCHHSRIYSLASLCAGIELFQAKQNMQSLVNCNWMLLLWFPPHILRLSLELVVLSILLVKPQS